MAQAQVVSFGGRDFAAGLLWMPLVSTNTNERQNEVKALGKELDLNLHVVHRDNTCVGLVKSGLEIKQGVLSLAAAVSDRLNELFGARDFIYVADIGGGRWYYLVQREGVIFPERDVVVTSEELARTMYYEDNSAADWPHVFAPAHWGITGAKEGESLSELLPLGRKGKVATGKGWTLSPITVTPAQMLARHAVPLIVIAMVLGGGSIGLDQFKKHQRQKAIEESLRIQAEIAARQEAVLPRPRPWGEIPGAVDQMNACLATLSQVHLFPGNWDLAGVNCSGGVLVVSWKPSGRGWIEHLKQVVPEAVISIDGSLASVTKPLPQLRTGVDEDVHESNARMAAMYAAAQRYGVKFLATPPVNNVPPALPGQAGAKPQVQMWDELGWKAEGVSLPEVVMDALDGNGFRLRAMSAQWQAGRLIWTMEGSQYVRK